MLLWMYIEWTKYVRGWPRISKFYSLQIEVLFSEHLTFLFLFLNCLNSRKSSFYKYLHCYSYFILIFFVYYSFDSINFKLRTCIFNIEYIIFMFNIEYSILRMFLQSCLFSLLGPPSLIPFCWNVCYKSRNGNNKFKNTKVI